MTSPDLEALKALVAKWREQAKILETGVPDFSDGLAASRTECANDLEKALERLLAGQREREPDWWLVPTSYGLQAVKSSNGYKPASQDAIALWAAPPVQEAGRDWLRTAFIKLAAYVAQRHHAEGCPTLAHPYERCTCGWDDMATNITRWNAQLNSPVAEPASLGAEDAAKEIFDLICDFNADKVEKISRTQLEAIIRKHQPIKAGDSGAEE